MARDVVGKVAQVAPRGELLVQAPRMVPPGTRLVDARRERVGKVVDVIGPVARPYLVVALPRGRDRGPPPNPLRLLGKELYRE